MDTPIEPPVIVSPARRRLNVFLKIGGICLLIGLLYIPLGMTHGVLNERRSFQAQAIGEIAGVWGREQVVTGPVLAVPYAYKTQVVRARIVNGRKVDVEETDLVTATAYFLPDALTATGAIESEVRHRGIYDAIVYATKLKLSGAWAPDFGAVGIVAERIDWEKARVLFGVSDLRGVRSVGPVVLNGGKGFAFEAAEAGQLLPLEAKVEGVAAGARVEFAMDVAVQGSEALQFVPVGKTTAVQLESTWADPSFTGAYLPVARTVTASGFQAHWETSHFSRGFPGAFTDRCLKVEEYRGQLLHAAFGVRFAQLADGYTMVDRAQKYGVLFFVLIFAVFFLFEITAGLRIHSLQYAIVGVALALFFLGFLALSEFWPTGRAYGVTAAVCTLLVAGYAGSFLQAGWRAAVIGGGLGATYGYLYFVLRSQDYALLAGTAALFAVLALVMFLTRRVNWYALDQGESTRAATQA